MIISLNGRLKQSLSEDFQQNVTILMKNIKNKFQCNLNNFKKENVYAIRA